MSTEPQSVPFVDKSNAEAVDTTIFDMENRFPDCVEIRAFHMRDDDAFEVPFMMSYWDDDKPDDDFNATQVQFWSFNRHRPYGPTYEFTAGPACQAAQAHRRESPQRASTPRTDALTPDYDVRMLLLHPSVGPRTQRLEEQAGNLYVNLVNLENNYIHIEQQQQDHNRESAATTGPWDPSPAWEQVRRLFALPNDIHTPSEAVRKLEVHHKSHRVAMRISASVERARRELLQVVDSEDSDPGAMENLHPVESVIKQAEAQDYSLLRKSANASQNDFPVPAVPQQTTTTDLQCSSIPSDSTDGSESDATQINTAAATRYDLPDLSADPLPMGDFTFDPVDWDWINFRASVGQWVVSDFDISVFKKCRRSHAGYGYFDWVDHLESIPQTLGGIWPHHKSVEHEDARQGSCSTSRALQAILIHPKTLDVEPPKKETVGDVNHPPACLESKVEVEPLEPEHESPNDSEPGGDNRNTEVPAITRKSGFLFGWWEGSWALFLLQLALLQRCLTVHFLTARMKGFKKFKC